jgi:serine/threonine protein kinase
LNAAVALTQGQIIAGNYRLEHLLGEGGMGSVWAASHVKSEKRFAVKFLKPELAMRAEIIHRFVREARAVTAVRHPNVVAVHEVSQLEDGTPFMVMDYLSGETLGQKLERERRLSAETTAGVLLPAIAAVGMAHSLGIVHRDLKPDNLFVTTEEGASRVKVLDFGIAKLTATEGEAAATGALTKTGSVLGTPFYMSPEQAFGEKDVDHRSDIWTFGIILYECLTGRRPTHADNVGQVFKAIMTGTFPLPSTIVSSVPPELDALVMKMLTRDREQRPQGLDEVRTVLEKFGTAGSIIPPPKTLVPEEGDATDLGSAKTQLSDSAILAGADTAVPSERARTLSAVGISSVRHPEAAPPPARSWTPLVAAALVICAVGGGALFVRSKNAPAASPSPTSSLPSEVAQATGVATSSAPSASTTQAVATPSASASLAMPSASASQRITKAGAAPASSASSRKSTDAVPSHAAAPSAAPSGTVRGAGGIVENPSF